MLCGGNIDLSLIGQIIEYSLASSGRLLMIEATVPDTPNQLVRLLSICGSLGANIAQVEHFRGEMYIPVGYTKVLFSMETYDAVHQATIVAALEGSGYAVRRISPGAGL